MKQIERATETTADSYRRTIKVRNGRSGKTRRAAYHRLDITSLDCSDPLDSTSRCRSRDAVHPAPPPDTSPHLLFAPSSTTPRSLCLFKTAAAYLNPNGSVLHNLQAKAVDLLYLVQCAISYYFNQVRISQTTSLTLVRSHIFVGESVASNFDASSGHKQRYDAPLKGKNGK